MKRRATVVALGVGMLVLTTAPVEGQLFNFPDYAVLSVDGGASTFVASSYGRGLNDESGKLNAVSAMAGKTSSGVSFQGGFGYIDGVGDSEWTLGGAASYDLLSGSSPAQVSLQGGVGWMQFGGLGLVDDITMLRFPIGVAIKGNVSSSAANVTPWVMPRLNVIRLSAGGVSTTETDFGASGGVSVTMPSGFGVHAALDLLRVDAAGASAQQLMFGVGAHYVLGR